MSREAPTEVSEVRIGRAGLLRSLLIGLLGIVAVATVASIILEGRSALSLYGVLPDLVIAVSLILGLWLLNRGHLASVVWLCSLILIITAANRLRYGIAENEAALLILIAPIALTGLILGRIPLYIVSAICIALPAAVVALYRSGVPVPTAGLQEIGPIGAVVLFGLIVGLLVLFLDRFAITLQDALERSSARERELRNEVAERQRLESRLQLATDAAKIGLWSWDPDSGEVDWSPQMKRLFGLPPDAEMTANTFLEVVHPEDRERVSLGWDELENYSGQPYRVILPDGTLRWLVGSGKSMTLPNGKRMALGAAYEVTPLVEAEAERQRLLDLEQAARRSAEGYADRLKFLAEAGRILSETLSYEETLDRLAHLVVPRMADWCAIDVVEEGDRLERVALVHSDREKIEFAENLRRRYPPQADSGSGPYRVVRSGEPILLEHVPDEFLTTFARDEAHLQMLREMGFSSAIAAPLTSRGRTLGVLTLVQAESGRHYDKDDLDLAMQVAERAGIAVDNARLYAQARDLNAELEERVEARTEELQSAITELESFTYSASHDLRAPLRGINGFSQALIEDYADELDGTAREYLQRIHAGAVRMGELIDDLLALSRISRIDFILETVDLTALAHTAIEAQRLAEPERNVEVRVEEGLTACADARLLLIALENLIGNAWKFTREKERALIEVGRNEDGIFFVRDNGAGFDMRYANKLFVPFQRLHPADSFGGTGIGLATSRRILERLGGKLWGEGEEGKGATFYFTLPSSADAVRRTA
ncbi:MAG TPA: ATP-binding protein [Trueperaceae bacterium]